MKKRHFIKLLVVVGMAGLAWPMRPVQAATVQSSDAAVVIDPIPRLPAAWQYNAFGWPAFTASHALGHALFIGPIGGPYYWALNDLGPVVTALSEVPAKALD
ncbi:MAG TPA: hypothetical protein VH877_00480 [Polyangia bacterium]|nr:hypothetical protein [Polyangia bacterium]